MSGTFRGKSGRTGLRVSAFAKLNLTLEVLGRRDDGYHEVRTVIQSIDLADQLEISPAPSLRVVCDDSSLDGENNLVWRAAEALAQRCGRRPQACIQIKKGIPVGMGLGGGSSDAGAALASLNRLWELDLPLSELSRIAATLGSDVPYFLRGGTALAKGRGEIVAPLPPLPDTAITLICPRATRASKTARLYAELTPVHYGDGRLTGRVAENLMAGRSVENLLQNVFEEVAFRMFPELEELYGLAEKTTGRRPHLTGAGPALFCWPSGEEEYFRLAKALQPFEAEAYFVRTLGREAFQFPAGKMSYQET